MSELQMALIVFGAVLVVLVWIYNLRQERQQRSRAEQLLQPTQPDVLMADREPARAEPAIGAPAAEPVPREPSLAEEIPEPVEPVPAPAVPPDAEAAGEAVKEEILPASATEQEIDLLLDDVEAVRLIAPVPAEWGDSRVDCLLRIEFAQPAPVAALSAEHASWSGRIDKPIQWLGVAEEGAHWSALQALEAGKVTHLAAALQLVDRKGPASEITLSAFIDGVHRLAQRFGGRVELPAIKPLQARARDLDAFCASVDLQLSLHVLPNGAELAGAKLKPLIEAAGLHLEGERFVAADAAGAEQFSLMCQAATAFPLDRIDAMHLSGLVFSLDVPRVAAGAAAFDRMLDCARQCAAVLGGLLADAHGKPLAEATVAAIRGRIAELHAKMVERGIPAGSVRALRLFS